jgi:hypothetical protein
MDLYIAVTLNDWTPEGPNTKCHNVTISEDRAYRDGRGSLTVGSYRQTLDFAGVLKVLDECRASYAASKAHPMNASRAGLITVRVNDSLQFQHGCWHQKYARDYPAIEAPESPIVVAIIDYIKGGDTPVEIIKDMILHDLCEKV